MRFDDRPDFKLLDGETQEALRKLAETSAGGPEEVDFSADLSTGRLLFLSGKFGGRHRASPAEIARRFLTASSTLFGIERDLAGLGEAIVTKLEPGSAVRMPQMVDEIRVYGAGIRVELDPHGTVTKVCARLLDARDAPREPRISRADAVIAARTALGLGDAIELEPELVLSDLQVDTEDLAPGRVSPAWLFSVDGPEAKVDALIGGAGAPAIVTTPAGTLGAEEWPSDVPLCHLNDVTGVPDFVTFGPNGTRTSGSASGDPALAAQAFFSDHPLMFGTGDVPRQLRVIAIQKDAGPPFQTHVVLQQIYGGLEVLGAQLRVHLSPALDVTSISGNYVRDPRVVPEPKIIQLDARSTAVLKIGQLRTQHGIPGDPAKDVQDDGIVVFPGELTRAPNARNAVAWRFHFPEATVLVDARSNEVHGGLLFTYPHYLGADRRISDAMGAGEISFPALVMENSVAVGMLAPNAEVASADAFLSAVLGFYSGLGRSSWDGKDSPADVVTNSVFTITPRNPAHWDIVRQQAWFQAGSVTAFTVGHEFTHGVTMATAFLIPIDEPGALNEHYSDVMGGLAIRDLTGMSMSPGTYSSYVPRSPACFAPEAVLTGSCDSGNVHINNGIGNRAANLLAMGDAPAGAHTGIGMNRLGRLFFETLTTRMHPWSTYIDERLNTWETARILAARGVLVPDDSNPAATLDFTGVAREVAWAFTAVGVTPALIPGWYSVSGSPFGHHSGATQTWWAGQTTLPCKLVSDMELVVRVFDPIPITGVLPWWEGRSRLTGPGGGSVVFPGGVFGASIVPRPLGTNSKETVVDYFHSGFLPFEFRPYPSEIDDPACPPPQQPPIVRPESEFVTSGRSHWGFGFGSKGNDKLNLSAMVREPGGADCTIDMLEVELLGPNGDILARTQLGQPDAVYHYGAFGEFSFGVRVVNAMLGTPDPGVEIHWWFDVGSAVRYRLHYYCTGDSCDIR